MEKVISNQSKTPLAQRANIRKPQITRPHVHSFPASEDRLLCRFGAGPAPPSPPPPPVLASRSRAAAVPLKYRLGASINPSASPPFPLAAPPAVAVAPAPTVAAALRFRSVSRIFTRIPHLLRCFVSSVLALSPGNSFVEYTANVPPTHSARTGTSSLYGVREKRSKKR